MAAVITGSVVIWFADAEGLADPAGEGNRSLTGRTILAILEHFTEPAT